MGSKQSFPFQEHWAIGPPCASASLAPKYETPKAVIPKMDAPKTNNFNFFILITNLLVKNPFAWADFGFPDHLANKITSNIGVAKKKQTNC